MSHLNQKKKLRMNFVTTFDAFMTDGSGVICWKSHHLQTVFDFVGMGFGPNNGQCVVV